MPSRGRRSLGLCDSHGVPGLVVGHLPEENEPSRQEDQSEDVPGVPSMPAAATIVRHPAAVSPNEAFQVNRDLQTCASMS